MSPLQLGLIAVFTPLVVATLLVVIRPLRHTGKPAAGLSILGAFASLGASVMLMMQSLGEHPVNVIHEVRWLPVAGETLATIGVQLDGISIPMMLVVSLVATCVQVFSYEYMNTETNEDFGRYFTWQSLFLFTMQGLVIAPNILQLFICWELVGLCSYLLIGFYWKKHSAGRAALKAFWITKFADIGLLVGLIAQYSVTGTFGWDPATVTALSAAGMINVVAGLYFFAVMGKSAQFPLHIWLPDAMEGPTPVSALLHAATMVAAGVFLIVRAFPIFIAAEQAMPVISVIGGVTAIAAACIAVVQTDIKKVLAYSTCSQLGYMVAALGAGSLMGGYFHLTTHAFFKALLFLASGSIIHAVHSNEMADMGGLFKKMKVTGTVYIIGSLALAGLPFFSGFYSKDLILETLFESAQHNPIFWVPFIACMVTAGLTAYYMGRVIILVFFGELGEKSSHAHEHGFAMTAPIVFLAIPALFAGLGGGQLAHLYGVHDFHFAVVHFTPVGIAASTLAFGGFAAAYAIHGLGMAGGLVNSLTPVGDFIRSAPIDRSWLFVYRSILSAGAQALGWFDRYVIDGAINAFGASLINTGERMRNMQTGRVNDYMHAVLMGILVMAAFSQVWLRLGA